MMSDAFSTFSSFFFFNDTATTEIYTYSHTLSLHDALPISLEIDIGAGEVAENFAAQLGARDQHVETALAALAAQRTEGMGEIALLGLAIADRDEDDVALVALDILQILEIGRAHV